MALTATQKQYIVELDNKAIQILQHGGEEALLMSLCHKMDTVKAIIDASSEDELNRYCQRYNGFYQYMLLLERMALGTSQGIFDDFLKD